MRVVAIVTGTLVAAVALHRTATTASPRVVESDAAKQPEASPAQQSEQIVKVPAAIAAPMPQGNPQFSGDGMILPPEPHQSASVVIPELPPDPTIAPSPVTPRIAAPNPAAFNAVVDQVVATEVSKASQPKQVSQPAASNSVKPVTVNPPAIVAAQTQLEPTPSAEIDRVPIAVAEPQLIAPPQPEAIPMPLQSSRDSAPIPVPEPQSIAQTQPDSTPMPPSAEIDRSTSPEVEPQAEFVAAGKSLAPEAGYVLGAGDRIRVDVFGVPEYSGEYAVNIDGTVNLPLVGSLSLNGLDLRQAADRIATRYAPLLTRSTVNVNLVTARSLRVAVSGEVSRPGSYAIAPEGNKTPSMTRLLQLAGGTTRSANLRQVQVRRPQANGTDQ
jgi:polysaccharide export outer membrane protein